MSKYNLLDIHEGMGYKEFSNSKEEERLDKHPDKMMIKKVKAMMAKEKAVKEGEAVDLAIEASQEKAGIKTENVIKEEADPIEAEMKMHLKQYNAGNIDGDDLARAFDEILNGRISPPGERGFNTTYGMEESFDSLAKKLDKQKGIDKEEAGKIAGSIAAKKMKGAGKGPTAKQKKRVAEADAIPTSAGEMERGDDGKMYNVIASNHDRKMAMKNIIDVLAKDGISTDDAFAFIKTHREDIFSGDIDAYDEEDIRMNWGEYVSINSEDFGDLRESFQRFL